MLISALQTTTILLLVIYLIDRRFAIFPTWYNTSSEDNRRWSFNTYIFIDVPRKVSHHLRRFNISILALFFRCIVENKFYTTWREGDVVYFLLLYLLLEIHLFGVYKHFESQSQAYQVPLQVLRNHAIRLDILRSIYVYLWFASINEPALLLFNPPWYCFSLCSFIVFHEQFRFLCVI